MAAHSPLTSLLAALNDLDDEELQAVIARAQALLLDRPAPLDTPSPLAVEIVGREERRVLTFYRALAPLARDRVLTYMRLCYARARGALQQHHGPHPG